MAKARLAKVSIIKLTHNNYIAVNTGILIIADPINVIPTATTLTVN